MKRLDIHEHPRAAIRTAAEILERFIDLDEVLLGGGTALEARWHHRESTDLDFFATGEGIDGLFYRGPDAVLDILNEFGERGMIDPRQVIQMNMDVLHFLVGSTPVSIGRVDTFHGSVEEVEHQTGIKLSSTEDILTKKLYNRLCLNGLATERDIYDFVVARTLDPSALRYAWDSLGPTYQRNVQIHLSEFVKAPSHFLTDRSNKLATPSNSVRVQGDIWEQAVKLFESELSYVPEVDVVRGREGEGYGR